MKKPTGNLRIINSETIKQSLTTSVLALSMIILFNELASKAFKSQGLKESIFTIIFRKESLIVITALIVVLAMVNYYKTDNKNTSINLINTTKKKKGIKKTNKSLKSTDIILGTSYYNVALTEDNNIESMTLINIDPLTGLYNHRYFHEYCEKMLKTNNFNDISLILIDIDKFKSINRNYGYAEGDSVLVNISNIVINIIKEHHCINNSLITRYGGEEIIIMLRDTDIDKAYLIAEDIRKSVYQNKSFGDKYYNKKISISSGVASISSPITLRNIDELVESAYLAMINSKASGRNKTSKYKTIYNTFKREPSNDQGIHKSVFALASTIDAKDEYTGHHSSLVSYYSTLIANKMNLDSDTIDSIETGSLLHDIGKISTPDAIITKNSKLSDEEYEIIKQHPTTGYGIVKLLTNDKISLDCIRHHHERWDGRGYPERLKGEEIPLAARVVCIADAFHAMTSDRSYREAQNIDWAIDELIKNKGTQFDPEIVDIFVPIAKSLRQ